MGSSPRKTPGSKEHRLHTFWDFTAPQTTVVQGRVSRSTRLLPHGTRSKTRAAHFWDFKTRLTCTPAAQRLDFTLCRGLATRPRSCRNASTQEGKGECGSRSSLCCCHHSRLSGSGITAL